MSASTTEPPSKLNLSIIDTDKEHDGGHHSIKSFDRLEDDDRYRAPTSFSPNKEPIYGDKARGERSRHGPAQKYESNNPSLGYHSGFNTSILGNDQSGMSPRRQAEELNRGKSGAGHTKVRRQENSIDASDTSLFSTDAGISRQIAYVNACNTDRRSSIASSNTSLYQEEGKSGYNTKSKEEKNHDFAKTAFLSPLGPGYGDQGFASHSYPKNFYNDSSAGRKNQPGSRDESFTQTLKTVEKSEFQYQSPPASYPYGVSNYNKKNFS